MGGMRYDEVRQCSVQSKELGPMVSISIIPYVNYEEMVMKTKEQFLLMIFSTLQICDWACKNRPCERKLH